MHGSGGRRFSAAQEAPWPSPAGGNGPRWASAPSEPSALSAGPPGLTTTLKDGFLPPPSKAGEPSWPEAAPCWVPGSLRGSGSGHTRPCRDREQSRRLTSGRGAPRGPLLGRVSMQGTQTRPLCQRALPVPATPSSQPPPLCCHQNQHWGRSTCTCRRAKRNTAQLFQPPPPPPLSCPPGVSQAGAREANCGCPPTAAPAARELVGWGAAPHGGSPVHPSRAALPASRERLRPTAAPGAGWSHRAFRASPPPPRELGFQGLPAGCALR